MKTFFLQLVAVAREQGLSGEQMALWRSFVLTAGDVALAPVCSVLSERPELIRLFTENLEKKVNAVRSNDAHAWRMIVKEEKEFLEKE